MPVKRVRNQTAAQLTELRGSIDGPVEHSFFRAVELEPASECAAVQTGGARLLCQSHTRAENKRKE